MKKSNGGAVLRTVRFCAVITLTTLVTWSAAISRAAGIGAQAQSEQAPKPPQASRAAKPAKAAVPKPNPDELEGWRQTIVHTRRPKKACYTAQYPAKTWTEVPCGKPPKVPFLPAQTPQIVGGQGPDVSAQAPPPQQGLITQAEGSFDSVTVKTECNTGCPIAGCTTKKTCVSSDKKNDFSLQINTNQAHSYACGASQKCRGWEQFIFSNRQCTSGLFGSQIGGSPACAFIEYWLFNYGPNCPPPWQQHGNNCTAWSQNSASVSAFLIADLGFMKLRGEAPGVQAADDQVIFTYADKVYSAPGDDLLPDVGQWWQSAEFNVVGDGSSSQAVFGPGTSLVVRTVVDSQTNNPPGCVLVGTTAESNNLILTQLPSRPTNAPINAEKLADIASTQSGNAVTGPYSGGLGPAVVFGESNAPDACPVVVGDSNAPPGCPAPVNAGGACAGEVLVGGTQPIPPPGHGTGGTAITGCGIKQCCVVPGLRACQKCSAKGGQCP